MNPIKKILKEIAELDEKIDAVDMALRKEEEVLRPNYFSGTFIDLNSLPYIGTTIQAVSTATTTNPLFTETT